MPSNRSSRGRSRSGYRSGYRASSRPGPRPGRRAGQGRGRTADGSRPADARPRFTGRAAILVLVLAVLAVSYASSMRAYLQQQAHLDSLRQDIAESRAHIAQLERENRRWKDPAYVETQARDRLGLVKAGEVAYQVIGADGKPLGHEDSLNDAPAPAGTRHPQWWQAAWGSVVAAGTPKSQTRQSQPAAKIRAPKKQQH